MLEDDDRVAYSGKDFRMAPHSLSHSTTLWPGIGISSTILKLFLSLYWKILKSDLLEVDLFNDEVSIRMKPYFTRVQVWPDCNLGELPNYQHEQLKTKKNTDIQKEIIKQRNESISMIEERYKSNLNQFDQGGFSLVDQ